MVAALSTGELSNALRHAAFSRPLLTRTGRLVVLVAVHMDRRQEVATRPLLVKVAQLAGGTVSPSANNTLSANPRVSNASLDQSF